ncbi:hypothetical protein F2Q68_00044998 [Brassica cretica]|uniref:Origin recognition complex subunit 5 C-terminal domain-containing protein n=1 Tax=Brassica cretica TaxID=69181 RepID=A0A8S9LLF1_BRACR|nr:hypothetical protein F2Q68_00044998 [Brassica cretica]
MLQSQLEHDREEDKTRRNGLRQRAPPIQQQQARTPTKPPLPPPPPLQVSSLCDANFMIKSGSCPLEGSIRYRSMVSEDLSLKVARSLSFPLSKYLYRR